MSESFSDSDNDGSTEKNLEWSDKYDLHSKFISEAATPENCLTSQDQKFSGDTSAVLTELNRNNLLFASDDSNSYITYINTNTNIINRASMTVSLGDGTGRTSRNLRPRQHMDKLSE